MKIEHWHLDLSSNERRMVVSQEQDLWRRILFLGVKEVRLMLQKSSCNWPSCFGLINSLRDRSCLNMTNNLPEARGSFHFYCWYSGLSSVNIIITANTGFSHVWNSQQFAIICSLLNPTCSFIFGNSAETILKIKINFFCCLKSKWLLRCPQPA